MSAPTIDLLVAAPVLAPAIGAVAALAVDAIAPRRRLPAPAVGAVALLAAVVCAVLLRVRAHGGGEVSTLCLTGDPAMAVTDAPGMVASDCLLRVTASGALLQALAAAAGAAVLVLLARRRGSPSESPAGPGGRPVADPGVEVALLLATVTGAAAVAVAHDLGTWLVGLELATLPVVALAVMRGGARDSGALNLITTSITSFAIAVVGAGLWMSATGSMRLGGVASWAAGQESALRAVLTLGIVMLVAAVAFKLSLVPFHAWAPTTYPRAGAEVAMLLASVSTVAALGGMVAVVRGSVSVHAAVQPALSVLAVVSMLIGAVLALRARDPLRLIAWSGVTQGGWVVAPLVAGDVDAAVGYLAVYVVAVVAALSVVASLSTDGPRLLEDDRGLLRRHPLHAAVLGLALLTFAGLPPGVAGLLAKFVVLRPLVDQGLWWVVLAAVVAVVIGFAAYLRWVALLLLPADDQRAPEDVDPTATRLAVVAGLVLLAATLVPVILLGTGTT
ncbi:proton-conducting transporter transmembrane domain-containing protein [Janibacter limosus]|uniref:proton-conducting transporter transmembrane domain-containing protein n=1 Tax=Janibacter limosus TaxID=53458 RepID=UPI00082DEE3A|nr:proton-conducting transporter membrane subunit [Janibacter limosus]